jgi:hypothetical protein
MSEPGSPGPAPDPRGSSAPDPSLAYEPPAGGFSCEDQTPPVPPPVGQPLPPPPYGAPACGQQQPPFGQPRPTGYAPGIAYPYRPTPSASVIALTVVSCLGLISCFFSLASLPSLIIAIVALARWSGDPTSGARLATIGWITFIGLCVLTLMLMTVALVAS